MYGYAKSQYANVWNIQWRGLKRRTGSISHSPNSRKRAMTRSRRRRWRAGLGVTRGSFYWHFEDLEAFKRDLIAHWTDRTTERARPRAVVREGDAQAQLVGLMARAFRSGASMERAVRAWATADDHVASLVAAVDWRRIRFAEQLLAALGVAEAEIGPPRADALLGLYRPADDGTPGRPRVVGGRDCQTRSPDAALGHLSGQFCMDWDRGPTAPRPRFPPTSGSSGSGQGRSGERRMMMSPFGSRSGIS